MGDGKPKGHFGGSQQTLAAAGDAQDPAKLYAAIAGLLTKMELKDVDPRNENTMILVKPDKFYTLMQAAKRSWRIGQKHPVKVLFLGYAGSSQMDCLKLMAKKISVSQSTSGDMPDSGLDVLNDAGDSLEVALAKKLLDH